MKNYPDKSCENVIPNRKSLKKWLKFENFHFIHRNFSFLRYGLCRNMKKCKTFSLEKRQEAAEILTSVAYFYLAWKRKKIDQKIKIFSFSLIFDFLWDMDKGKKLRNSEKSHLETLWKTITINPLNVIFLTQKWKWTMTKKIFICSLNFRHFVEIRLMTRH